MDIQELERLLTDMKEGRINLVAKDLREPSPLSQEILNARPYAFLDNAPLEERRTNAIRNRRWLDPTEAKELAKLDPQAIDSVKSEAWPEASTEDELHDALVLCGYITSGEGSDPANSGGWTSMFEDLITSNKAARVITAQGDTLWVAIERFEQFRQLYDKKCFVPLPDLPAAVLKRLRKEDRYSDPVSALIEIIRGRLEALGPVTSLGLSSEMGLPETEIEQALLALENDGFVFRGQFTPEQDQLEWCERRLLARIHRYTLQKLRKEIEPVSPATFMEYLFAWQHLTPSSQPEGPGALEEILNQLEGYEAPAAAWESHIIPARIKDYDYLWLDVLCLSGKILWGRFRPYPKKSHGSTGASPIKTTPVSLVNRRNLQLWKTLHDAPQERLPLGEKSTRVLGILEAEGATFYEDLVKKTSYLKVQVEEALSNLVAEGLVTSDSFTGLRALLVPSKYRLNHRSRRKATFDMDQAGRWSLIEQVKRADSSSEQYQKLAWILLKRYGIVFRKITDRESAAPPWRELVKVFRKMESRGEIRGGRFVTGVWGEQYALPEAVKRLREVRRQKGADRLVAISASDPLNLIGVITPGKRIPSYLNNRILFKNGEPIAIKEGKDLQFLKDLEKKEKWTVQNALIQRNIPPRLRAYLGRGIS